MTGNPAEKVCLESIQKEASQFRISNYMSMTRHVYVKKKLIKKIVIL